MKPQLILFLTLSLLCTGAGAALAQTPDHLPPARETVCDNETGAAYGLCNAYCEAMDCELANDSDPLTAPKASSTACNKVRTKFQKIAGRDVPCEVSCPCLGVPEFSAFLTRMNYCYDGFGGAFASLEAAVPEPPFFPELIVSISPDGPELVCGYLNVLTESQIILPITTGQAAACVQAIHTAAANRGVTCQPFPF
jgi:hypothetical protein